MNDQSTHASVVDSPAYREAILDNLMENDRITMGNGLVIIKTSDMQDEYSLRLVVPMELANEDTSYGGSFLLLARDLLETMFSDTTNDDACDVTIRERSAHFSSHEDLKEWHDAPFGTWVIIDARIEDYLT